MKKLVSIKSVILFIFLLAVIVAGMVYMNKSQDIRNKAAFVGANLSMNPANITRTGQSEFTVGLILNSGTFSVTGAQLQIIYDPTLVQITNFVAGKPLPMVLTQPKYGAGEFTVTLGAQPQQYLKGTDIVGTITVKALTDRPASLNYGEMTLITAIEQTTNIYNTGSGTVINRPVNTNCTNARNGSPCTTDICPTSAPCPSGAMCGKMAYLCRFQTGTCQDNKCVVTATPTPYPCTGPDGSVCEAGICPPQPTCAPNTKCIMMERMCKLQTGICTAGRCIVKTTPTPPPGCFYKIVQCVKAPCDPILVCPTPSCIAPPPECVTKAGLSPTCDPPAGATWCMPTPSVENCTGQTDGVSCKRCKPCTGEVCSRICIFESGVCKSQQCVVTTVTPSTTTCVRNKPTITLTPSNQSAMAGQMLTYTVKVTNNDSQGCARSDISLSGLVPSGWTYKFGGTVITNNYPGNGFEERFYVTSPAGVTTQQTVPVRAIAKNVSSGLEAQADASFTVVPTATTSAPQSLEFRVKLAGVSANTAEGAKILVKFVKSDGSTVTLSQPLTLAHIGSGVYKALASLTNPLPAGTKYTVKIKGEKHVSIKFCALSGQTTPCKDTDFITVPATVPGSYVYDFSGISLPPGDLPIGPADNPQNGVLDEADTVKFLEIIGKLRSAVTAADLKIADLNYDKIVNGLDANLLSKTLSIRVDE